MAKQIVILIHGVNPDRQWQERVKAVLEPHFDCRTFSYADYDTFVGPIRAIANPWALFAALVSLIAGTYYAYAGRWLLALIALVAALAFTSLALMLAYFKRDGQVDFIKSRVDEAAAYGQPHIIAHSLGTYLIGNTLRKFEDVRLGSVILVNSVLPDAFPWGKLRDDRPESFRKALNEFGTADRVTWLVNKLRWLVKDMGGSGVSGFDRSAVVHTLPRPMADCDECKTSPGVVHNVPYTDYGHSTVFVGRRHARTIWLPFLWDIAPNEFLSFLDECNEAARLQSDKLWQQVDPIVTKIWGSSYDWTHNKTLVAHVTTIVEKYLEHDRSLAHLLIHEIVEDVRTLLHVVIATACSELDQEGGDENTSRGLHPNIAIIRAIEIVLVG